VKTILHILILVLLQRWIYPTAKKTLEHEQYQFVSNHDHKLWPQQVNFWHSACKHYKQNCTTITQHQHSRWRQASSSHPDWRNDKMVTTDDKMIMMTTTTTRHTVSTEHSLTFRVRTILYIILTFYIVYCSQRLQFVSCSNKPMIDCWLTLSYREMKASL